MALPRDPFILLSVINTKLRDAYPSLDALCEDLEEDKNALTQRLTAIGFHYDEAHNQFL